MSLRKRKIAKTKMEIFRAAMDLYRQKGFDGTSVEAIVERAGFSRATFFNHFGSKQGIFRYYGEQLQEGVDLLVSTIDAESDPLESVRMILLHMANDVEKHREDLELVYLYSMRDPNYLAAPTPARERFLKLVVSLLQKAQHQGIVRQDMPETELALHVLAMYQFAVLAIISGRSKAQAAIQSMWRFIIGGIRGDH